MRRVMTISIILLVFPVYINATVIDTVTAAPGSLGNWGTSTDPLEIGESIMLKFVLDHNPYPYTGFPSYDGYLLSNFDLSLIVSGPGSLEGDVGDKIGDWEPVWENHALIYVDYLGGGLQGPADISLMMPPAPPISLYDYYVYLRVVATGAGIITSDLAIGISSDEYSPYSSSSGNPYPDPPGWLSLIESDLGDLTLYVVPEPTTLLLLGLGALALRKRT